MLQTALWVHALLKSLSETSLASHNLDPAGAGEKLFAWPKATLERLAAATIWLLEMIDADSGQAPNLGPNDGAYILPWTVCPFEDYRPTAQAASFAFLGGRVYAPGLWDEMAVWLGCEIRRENHYTSRQPPAEAYSILRNPASKSWAYLRAARFRTRPGHADQLHLDLWWRGLNVARDAGTYSYNASPPWDNSLARTAVHNTVSVDGRDQMTLAGRFLWLDWAQAAVLHRETDARGHSYSITAQHDGYRRLGLRHQRTVVARSNGDWWVRDRVLADKPAQSHLIRVHWLLPDWPWELECQKNSIDLKLSSPHGVLRLKIGQPTDRVEAGREMQFGFQLARAGEKLVGDGVVNPVAGWYSPTYGVRRPALSIAFWVREELPVTLVSEWIFPHGER